MTRYDRLWSTLPYLRPLLTITNDSLEWYGVDEDGARVHDLLGSRCDPYVNRILSDEDFDFHCHSNLTRAVLPYGLTEFDVHDVLNLFTVTGLNDEDQYYMKPSPAKAGDFFEFSRSRTCSARCRTVRRVTFRSRSGAPTPAIPSRCADR